ncbi:MAG: hypothetical protein Q9219_005428 [cf. Caloplaca sp. 3 TL-2023]
MASPYESKHGPCLSSEHLLPSEDDAADQKQAPRPKGGLNPWLLPALLSAILSGVLVATTPRNTIKVDDLSCLKAQSIWSPALEATLPLHNVKFNGTLEYPSDFRGPPSPELDDAWETLVNRQSIGAFGISDADFLRLNQTLDGNTTRLGDYQGGQLFATLEVFHQLHCLNFIREYTHKDYYESRSPSFTDPPSIVRTHVDHCIEMLRQKLTCDADVGIITYNWVAVRELPWPNFNVLHKCRNFDGVVEWGKKHNAPYNGVPLKRPAGVVGLQNPP